MSSRTTRGGGSGAAEMAVYKRPFSNATNAPRIPDGKASSSTGQRFQSVKEYKMKADVSTMTFDMFGGLGAGLNVVGTSETDIADNYMTYENHGLLYSNGSEAKWKQQDGQAICRWRLVSQAVRLTLVNNAEQNDGWWEAIRVPQDNDIGKKMVLLDAKGGADGGRRLVLQQVNEDLSGSTDFVNHPSYMTGKLRNIHKVNFQLMPNNTDHRFTQTKTEFELDNTTRIAAVPGGFRFTSDTTDVAAFADQGVDLGFDRLLIRIHGRPGTTSTTKNSGTRILAHVVSNQEIIYEAGGFATRFHMPTNKRKMDNVRPDRQVSARVSALS
jgi:hypothetical protein